MFLVVSKRTGIEYTVYATDGDDSFLIFFRGEFRWEPMCQFIPKDYKEVEQEDTKQPIFRKQKREQVMYP